jgi:hypothetical protein
MLAVLLAGFLTVSAASAGQRPLRAPDMAACLGTKRFALNLETLASARALMSEAAWRTACRQAREANARRLATVRTILTNGAPPPAGYASTIKFLQQARSASDPTLRTLYRRVARDQAARESLGRLEKAAFAPGASPTVLRLVDGLISADAVAADAANQAWLKAVVARRGWFTISRDGEAADRAARLIVQHADADPVFQREMLGVLEPLAASGETDARLFAFTYDRWAMNAGQPQRYGIMGDCAGPGRWTPRPIEDEGRLEERRTTAGLPPMAQYRTEHASACH